jgi:hypothetical protein
MEENPITYCRVSRASIGDAPEALDQQVSLKKETESKKDLDLPGTRETRFGEKKRVQEGR